MLFPPVPSNNGHYNGVLEILQNIEKILQCKVHNIPPNHMQQACLARIFHEWPAATADMTALPGVLGCRTLRRTVQYASGPPPLRLPGGTDLSTVSQQQFMKYPSWQAQRAKRKAYGARGHKAQGTRKLRDGARRRREEEVAKRPWSVVRCPLQRTHRAWGIGE